MGAWIESHQSLGNHPKLIDFAALLNTSLAAAIGHLHSLWWWAVDYAEDGELTRISPRVIAKVGLWDGDPEVFLSALVEARGGKEHGFVESVEGRLVLHDWYAYAGKLIQARKNDRARKGQKKTPSPELSDIYPPDLTGKANGKAPSSVGDPPLSAGIPAEVDRIPGVTVTGTKTRDLDPRGTPEIQVLGSLESADSRGTAVPPSPSPEEKSTNGKSPYQRFVERLEAKENPGVVFSEALVQFYGSAFPPQPARLVKLAKELNSRAAFLKLLVKCSTTWSGLDDPHDYVSAAVKRELVERSAGRKPSKQGNPFYNPDIGATGPVGQILNQRIDDGDGTIRDYGPDGEARLLDAATGEDIRSRDHLERVLDAYQSAHPAPARSAAHEPGGAAYWPPARAGPTVSDVSGRRLSSG